ncbi:uncharacterized protein RHIMIDRAFT_15101 [Rhizopus microsporus ATCC 52813]|uniref:Uncharacterized protein n=1 Tax=Rhizopus microsporus ATCC 52813 TaxID=1340429 RepID=A0A2G4TAH3_RHIZD|nr:uncharacterized protein RHIMIDRAFT_15101 [Rhizopus microsporus ATCC 52813]PHZ18010.1 hypothetical protein RHIMIDRAFT_15101 [Rhizopus microsporus ATCC 52813]
MNFYPIIKTFCIFCCWLLQLYFCCAFISVDIFLFFFSYMGKEFKSMKKEFSCCGSKRKKCNRMNPMNKDRPSPRSSSFTMQTTIVI